MTLASFEGPRERRMSTVNRSGTSGTVWSWQNRVLGGLPIAVLDTSAVVDGFMQLVEERRAGTRKRAFYSTSANGEVICMAAARAEVQDGLLASDQILADGMPMVFYSRLRSAPRLPERIATTDLIHAVAERAQGRAVSFYLLGGSEEVNRRAAEALKQRYPSLVIAGRHHGYFDRDQEAAVVADVNRSKADIVWVGLGVPLEQFFVERNRDQLTHAAVVKTCGGLFDFLSGRRARAPRLVQALGFEWAWRAMLEPRRLGKRYWETNGTAIRLLISRSQ